MPALPFGYRALTLFELRHLTPSTQQGGSTGVQLITNDDPNGSYPGFNGSHPATEDGDHSWINGGEQGINGDQPELNDGQPGSSGTQPGLNGGQPGPNDGQPRTSGQPWTNGGRLNGTQLTWG